VIAPELFEALSNVPDAVVRRKEPLAHHVPLRVGGPADGWVATFTEKALVEVLRLARKHTVATRIHWPFQDWIVREGGAARTAGRQADVDGIAELVAGKPEPQADGILPRRALHLLLAANEKLGIVVPDQRVQNEILQYPAFQTNGKFDASLYKAVLTGQNREPTPPARTTAQRLTTGPRRGPRPGRPPARRRARTASWG